MPSDPQRQPGAENQWEPRESQGERPRQATDHQLRAAIRKTLEQTALDECGNSTTQSPLDVITKVARRHPTVAAIQDSQVAVELVCELGKHALPAHVFHPAIERASTEIATALLTDPIASEHLARAWLSARTAAGLNEA